MKATLEYLHAELKLNINTLCKQLRKQTYPKDSELLQAALQNMTYFSLLSDELRLILTHRNEVIKAMERYLRGEDYTLLTNADSGEQVTIYRYCQVFFEKVDCPLGSSTDELKGWVATHPDRQQIVRKDFDKFFPNIDFLLSENNEAGDEQLRLVTDAELFNSKTDAFLRDIEDSNALSDFNQRMQQAHDLLRIEADVVDVLTVIKGEVKPQ